MKKIIYLLSFLVVSFYATAQTQVIRTTPANTVADSRLRALLNFYIPFGTNPSLNGGKDTVGGLFFKTLDSTLNVRVGNNINNSWLPLASRSYVDSRPIGVDSNYVKQVIRDSTIATDTSGIGDKFHPYYNLPGKNVIFVTPGRARAAENGIISNGATDQTAALNTLFATSVKEVIIDVGPVKISNVVNARGKKIIFQNGAYFVGVAGSNADTLKNALIECDFQQKAFDTSLAVTGITNSEMSVMWFGAIADYSIGGGGSPTDNLLPFNRAIAASQGSDFGLQNIPKATIHIPICPDTYTYYLSNTWIINAQVNIVGDGPEQSRLVWPGGHNGIKFTAYASSGSTMRDVGLQGCVWRGQSPSAQYDSTSHGILLNANNIELNNVSVRYFSGDGIANFADVGAGGNANNNRFSFCISTGNSGGGIHFIGGDANACSIWHGDYSGNAIAGVWEESFLGNGGFNIHVAATGTYHDKNSSFVSFGGHGYRALKNNKGVTPGTDPTVWQDDGTSVLTNPFPIYITWQSTRQYFWSGAYLLEGTNQRGSWLNCYAETDQNAGENLGNNIVINGFAAVMRGNTTRVLQGITTFKDLEVLDDSTGGALLMRSIGNDSYGYLAPGGSTYWQIKYYSDGTIGLGANNTGSGVIFQSSATASPNLMAYRAAWPDFYNPTFKGLFLKERHAGYYKYLTFSDLIPTAQTWDGPGDWCFSTDPASGLLGWQFDGAAWQPKSLTSGSSLTNHFVGYGSGTNFLTGSSALQFDGANKFSINATSSGAQLSLKSPSATNAFIFNQGFSNPNDLAIMLDNGTALWQIFNTGQLKLPYYAGTGTRALTSASDGTVGNSVLITPAGSNGDLQLMDGGTGNLKAATGTFNWTGGVFTFRSPSGGAQFNMRAATGAYDWQQVTGYSVVDDWALLGNGVNYIYASGGNVKIPVIAGTGNNVVGTTSNGTLYNTGIDPATITPSPWLTASGYIHYNKTHVLTQDSSASVLTIGELRSGAADYTQTSGARGVEVTDYFGANPWGLGVDNSGNVFIQKRGTYVNGRPLYWSMNAATGQVSANAYSANVLGANFAPIYAFPYRANHEIGWYSIDSNTVAMANNRIDLIRVNNDSTLEVGAHITAAQKAAIASPRTGAIIYQTDGTAGLYLYNGSSWGLLGGSGTIDATPTNGSTNAVQSGGVYTALGLKADVASPTFTGVITTPKVKGNGSAPTVAVGPSITGTVSVTGTDVAGEVTLIITVPSGLATNDQLFTLTFNSAYGTAPYVVYSPSSATSSTTMATSYVKSVGTTNFVLGVANSGTYAATTYKWTYHVMQ